MADSCEHVAAVLAVDSNTRTPFLDKLAKVTRWSVHRAQGLHHAPKRRKVAAPSCGTCGLALSRPLACLQCDFIGCWKEGHATGHLSKEDHSFCIDVHSGSVFCSACDDFVHDHILQRAYSDAVHAAEVKETRFQSGKRLREMYDQWSPSNAEKEALDEMTLLPCQGRRGLLNLGQTCFLNVVLQALIHNPILRAHFLADRHNRALCGKKDCTCCELDTLFVEIYGSDSATPFGPTGLLAATWRTSSEMAGYAQRDAHECLIGLLQALHSSSRGSTNVSCNCIIHAAFAGAMQSDVRCARCGNVTSTVDPMLDVSLELKPSLGTPAGTELTLAGCLRRFTQPEKLSSKEYTCNSCGRGTAHEATKRMSIRKLPPVLSFQFKRFEHKMPETPKGGSSSQQQVQSQKIDAPVRVPAMLDMYPYTSIAIAGSAKENKESKGKNASNPPKPSHTGPAGMYEYDLFAVICHEGQLDNGHYIIFARYQDEWCRYDDDKVTLSSLGATLAAPAYMCFYVKRRLDYKPDTTPDYILARKAEAAREEEREREKERARAKEFDDELLATVG